MSQYNVSDSKSIPVPPITPAKIHPTGNQEPPSPLAYSPDTVNAERMTEVVREARSKPADLTTDQLKGVTTHKATCPFIGSAVASGALKVRNNEDKPLASVVDVEALGNTGDSGKSNLGEVLKVFALGNHAFMPGATGALDTPVPMGLFSLDFPGSQGSHPGHSGILQGDPTQLNSGRLSQEDLNRLLSKAQNGYLKRSDIAQFIAENLIKDPNSKVFQAKAGGLLAGDLEKFVSVTGPDLLKKLHKSSKNGEMSADDRKVFEALTKTLGEDNLIGSSGEFGLLMALLAHSPNTKKIGGEPAIRVEDVRGMFQDHKLPDGWEHWDKTAQDWVVNTTALLVDAGRDYLKLKMHPS
jgi:hypothetical protein